MLKIVLVFLIIFIGILAGPFIADEQGIALFQIASYRIKMRLTTFVLLNILLFLLCVCGYWFVKKIIRVTSLVNRSFSAIFHSDAAKKINLAQLRLLEGDYQNAEKLLRKNAKYSNNQTLYYLQATQAAIDNFALQSAKVLLAAAAVTCTDREKLAFQLVNTRLLIKNNALTKAERLIEQLLEHNPKQPEVLRLAYNIYCSLNNYKKNINIMPALYKNNAYPHHQLQHYEQTTYLGLIRQLAQQPDKLALKNWWQQQPKAIKKSRIYQKEVARQFNLLGQFADAEELIAIIKNSAE